ncbi:MAG TPA: acyl-CoA dehydrogenase family protein, partial [Accumulibacter sp.]|nr:acyl-CoA dehydrogenase family protein [Accumulibacter sp.]
MNQGKDPLSSVTTYLAAADAVLGKSLRWLKGECTAGKGLSNDKLDEHQQVCFDLAWCAAEAAGARFAVDYAARAAAANQDASLEERMAAIFCAEALQNISNRLSARPQCFGLTDDDLAALAAPAIRAYCHGQLDARNLEALGREVIVRNGASGAYLLDEHATMMQDTFRKLATSVVMPLAE